MTNGKPFKPTATIAGAVVLALIMVIGIVALANRGEALSANAKTLVIANMVTVIPGLIASLLAYSKSTQAAEKTEEMHHELQNGLIPEKVKEGITEMAEDPAVKTVTITSETD